MFGQTIGEILPLAVAVAISPLPVSAVILMLISRRAHWNSIGFFAGWAIGLIAIGAIVLAFGGASSSGDGGASTASGLVKLGLGGVFIVLAVRQWGRRPREGRLMSTPPWMAGLDRFSVQKAFALGLALSAINPKNLGLTIAAASTIAAADLSSGDEISVFAVFLVVGCSTVAAPTAYFAVAGKQAREGLERMKTWLIAHSSIVMTVLLTLIAAKLIGDGLGIVS